MVWEDGGREAPSYPITTEEPYPWLLRARLLRLAMLLWLRSIVLADLSARLRVLFPTNPNRPPVCATHLLSITWLSLRNLWRHLTSKGHTLTLLLVFASLATASTWTSTL